MSRYTHTGWKHLKVTGTVSWMKLVCHKLACITFPTKKMPHCYSNQSLQYLAIVQHNTNFATVRSQMTVGDCFQLPSNTNCFAIAHIQFSRKLKMKIALIYVTQSMLTRCDLCTYFLGIHTKTQPHLELLAALWMVAGVLWLVDITTEVSLASFVIQLLYIAITIAVFPHFGHPSFFPSLSLLSVMHTSMFYTPFLCLRTPRIGHGKMLIPTIYCTGCKYEHCSRSPASLSMMGIKS